MARQVSERIAELWKLHSAQQLFYKMAMREDISGELRRLYGKGYLISSVCMKEISEMYDQLRCPVSDRMLRLRSADTFLLKLLKLPEGRQTDHVIRYLRDAQARVLKKYEKVLAHFEKGEAGIRVLSDHIFVLSNLAEKLERIRRGEQTIQGVYRR